MERCLTGGLVIWRTGQRNRSLSAIPSFRHLCESWNFSKQSFVNASTGYHIFSTLLVVDNQGKRQQQDFNDVPAHLCTDQNPQLNRKLTY